VAAILFDEPLTVIDPHLKWRLRSKLKELHQRVGATMIYVTHDQTEALTFADQVVVMMDGQVVQAGTPVELFERPHHTFVGHFIGSPGMNLLPCEIDAAGVARIDGQAVQVAATHTAAARGKRAEIGVRPEFISFASEGLPVRIERVADVGRFRIVETRCGAHPIKVLVGEGAALPSELGHLRFDAARTQVYADGWIVE
jgi:glycerol transport system ATP-binding protein